MRPPSPAPSPPVGGDRVGGAKVFTPRRPPAMAVSRGCPDQAHTRSLRMSGCRRPGTSRSSSSRHSRAKPKPRRCRCENNSDRAHPPLPPHGCEDRLGSGGPTIIRGSKDDDQKVPRRAAGDSQRPLCSTERATGSRVITHRSCGCAPPRVCTGAANPVDGGLLQQGGCLGRGRPYPGATEGRDGREWSAEDVVARPLKFAVDLHFFFFFFQSARESRWIAWSQRTNSAARTAHPPALSRCTCCGH